MAEAAFFDNTTIHIQENSGQIAIGNYIVQIGSIHGGLVNISLPEQQPRPQPRPTPVLLRPRHFSGLLDRKAEVKTAVTALQSAQPVEFYGQAGLGKTSLLRHLAHHLPTASYPDGVIYLSVRHQPLGDLFQALFDAFYESDVTFKPTEVQTRQALQNKRAIILLDDLNLARDEIQQLMDTVPKCAFFLTSIERRLWGEGQAIALQGLPPNDMVALLEQELHRPLTSDERALAPILYTALKGHPLQIRQTAALIKDDSPSLLELIQKLQQGSAAKSLTIQNIKPLSKPERRIIRMLAVLGGASLTVGHLTILTRVADLETVLGSLVKRGLIQADDFGYHLPDAVVQTVQNTAALNTSAERVLAHLTTWAEQVQQTPDLLIEGSETILQMLRWAVETGHWTEALRLTRAIENALALTGRWETWGQVLQWGLQSAQALKNPAAEAWALHQLGTRALCLGDAATASLSLRRALRLREALGDQVGAVITRHNLNLVLGPPPPPKKPPETSTTPQPNGSSGWGLLHFFEGVAAILFVIALGLAAWLYWPKVFPPPSTPVAIIAASPTPTETLPPPTLTPTNTNTPTGTPLPTDTSTPTATPTDTPTPTDTSTFTPTPTDTPTHTPTPTTPPTFTPTFTPTPTDTPTITPTPMPVISFSPQFITIDAGDCVDLAWRIEHVQAAFLSGGEFNNIGVTGPTGSTTVCPKATTIYTLRVNLLGGGQETYTATVTIKPNTPPSVGIIRPLQLIGFSDIVYDANTYDSTKKMYYANVQLLANATDAEDGVLSGSSIVWTTDRPDLQNSVLGRGAGVTARLYGTCGKNQHKITVTATDSGGEVDTAVRNITIRLVCIE